MSDKTTPVVPILAVDFDGCLCGDAWPLIGEANHAAIELVKERRKRGWKVILWTCREGALLNEALKWCAKQGLEFDAVNENLPEIIAAFGGDCRKISATEYWDDRAIRISTKEIDNVALV